MSNYGKIIEDYNEGIISLEDATIELRERRKEAEKLIESVKKFEHDNLENYSNESYMGFEFKVVNGRKTYDYSNINSVENAKNQLKEAQESAKAAFELYQKTGQRPITEDGELLELPELKYGKSYLKITKSK